MDEPTRHFYTTTMKVTYSYSMLMYEDESPKEVLQNLVENEFNTFLKDNATSLEPESIEILEVEEVKS